MRKLFTIASLAAALTLVGGTLTATEAQAGGNKKHHHHHKHHGHYNGYYAFGGLATGFALGYALNAYSQPEVQYVAPAPTYYVPYPPPPQPYYYAPAPVPAPIYGTTVIVP